MNGQMVEIVKDVINNYKSSKSYKCKYCERSFVKESTLLAHMCEPKRRWEQKNEKHIQLGLQAYLYFFKQTQSNSTNKGYKDIKSYFIANNKNKIVQDIINGRISPWVIFSTETGKECLGKLNEEQVQLVYPYIDPDYWRQHLIKFNKESKIVKDTLKEVGF